MDLNPGSTFRNVGKVWSDIKKFAPPEIHDQIMRMRTIDGNTGAVFDVREQDAEEFEAAFANAR